MPLDRVTIGTRNPVHRCFTCTPDRRNGFTKFDSTESNVRLLSPPRSPFNVTPARSGRLEGEPCRNRSITSRFRTPLSTRSPARRKGPHLTAMYVDPHSLAGFNLSVDCLSRSHRFVRGIRPSRGGCPPDPHRFLSSIETIPPTEYFFPPVDRTRSNDPLFLCRTHLLIQTARCLRLRVQRPSERPT